MGWSTATMLYDLANGPPEPGSLLESLFILLAKKRREADFFKTKFLAEAILAPYAKSGDGLSKAMEAYRSATFPFLADAIKKKDAESKKLLEQWVTKRAFRIKPLWRAQDHKAIVSKLKRGAERIKKSEEDRRSKNYRRI